MPQSVKVDGTYKPIVTKSVKVSNEYRTIANEWVKVDGTYRLSYTSGTFFKGYSNVAGNTLTVSGNNRYKLQTVSDNNVNSEISAVYYLPVNLDNVNSVEIQSQMFNQGGSAITSYFIVSSNIDGNYQTYDARSQTLTNGLTDNFINTTSLNGNKFIRIHLVGSNTLGYGYVDLIRIRLNKTNGSEVIYQS